MLEKCDSTAYLAGLVDADGCITMKTVRGVGYVVLLVTGTDPKLAGWLCENFGGSARWLKRSNPKWKMEFHWQLSHRRAIDLIEKLRPFLVIKTAQADLALAFKYMPRERVSNGKSRRFDMDTQDGIDFIRTAMKALNRRGVDAPDPWPWITDVAEGKQP